MNTKTNRREAVRILGGVLASLIGAVGIVHYLVRREPSADETVVLGRLTDFPVGEFQRRTFTVTEHRTWFDVPAEKTVWLRRNADDTLLVFTATCPHRNCLVNLEEAAFHCPCHHSRFDLDGKVLVPPALRPLDTLECRISENGLVSVQFQNFKREIATKELVPFSRRIAS